MPNAAVSPPTGVGWSAAPVASHAVLPADSVQAVSLPEDVQAHAGLQDEREPPRAAFHAEQMRAVLGPRSDAQVLQHVFRR